MGKIYDIRWENYGKKPWKTDGKNEHVEI